VVRIAVRGETLRGFWQSGKCLWL